MKEEDDASYIQTSDQNTLRDPSPNIITETTGLFLKSLNLMSKVKHLHAPKKEVISRGSSAIKKKLSKKLVLPS